jgi:hypothetical protein
MVNTSEFTFLPCRVVTIRHQKFIVKATPRGRVAAALEDLETSCHFAGLVRPLRIGLIPTADPDEKRGWERARDLLGADFPTAVRKWTRAAEDLRRSTPRPS